MDKIEMIRWLESLLLSDYDKLMLIDGGFDLLEIFLANIVQVHASNFRAELSEVSNLLTNVKLGLTLIFEPGGGISGVILSAEPVA